MKNEKDVGWKILLHWRLRKNYVLNPSSFLCQQSPQVFQGLCLQQTQVAVKHVLLLAVHQHVIDTIDSEAISTPVTPARSAEESFGVGALTGSTSALIDSTSIVDTISKLQIR
jgi:hypothetical protein